MLSILEKTDSVPQSEKKLTFERLQEVLADSPPVAERPRRVVAVDEMPAAEPVLPVPPSHARTSAQGPPAKAAANTAGEDAALLAALHQFADEFARGFRQVLVKTVSDLQAPAVEERRMPDAVFDSARRVARDLEALSARLELACQKIDSQAAALQELAGQTHRLEDSANVLAAAVHSVQDAQQGLEKRSELQARVLSELNHTVQCRGDQLDQCFHAVQRLHGPGIDQGPSRPLPQRLFEIEEPASASEPEPVDRLTHLPLVRIRPPLLIFRQRGRLAALVVCVALLCGATIALRKGVWQSPAPPAKLPAATSAVRTESITSKHLEWQDAGDNHPSVGGQRLPPGQPATLQPTGRLLVSLTATEATWVTLTVDGRAVFVGLLSPGETKSFQGTERMSLRVGNAGGLEIHWNGQPIGPIGRRGEVCVVAFTREGFQIHHQGM